MKINDFFVRLGYDITDLTEGFRSMQHYLGWYKGFVDEFHRYYIYNGEKRINLVRSSLNITKKICEDFARLLMNEKVKISVGNAKSNDILEKILTDNKFHLKANFGIEKTFALGTGAFLVSISDITNNDTGKVKIQFVNATDIYPLTFDENEITECAFTNYSRKVDEQTGKVLRILNLQVHTLNEQNNYIIRNYKFIEGENKDLTPIDLNDVTEQIDTGMPNRWFVIIKPNIINNIDLYSPFGLPVIANSIDIIKGLDKSYDSLVNEIQYGRKRLFVTAEAMKVSSDGSYKEAFDPNDAVFYVMEKGFGDKDSTYIKEDNGELRVDELSKAIQFNLNLLSLNLGMGTNFYKFDNSQIVKTATEVMSENSTLFNTIVHHEILLESAIHELVDTIGAIVGFDTSDFKINFDDSIIESKEQDRLEDRQDVDMGTMSLSEYRAKWRNETLEEAKLKIEEIKEEMKTSTQTDMFNIENNIDEQEQQDADEEEDTEDEEEKDVDKDEEYKEEDKNKKDKKKEGVKNGKKEKRR